MVFPVVMYGCESWAVKKAEFWRIDAFDLCCWRRLLRVPWSARRSSQSILKEISPEYSSEGLMLKLKLNTLATWCEELTHLKRPRCWERLREGGDGDDRGWDGWMASLTQWTWVWANSRNWWWAGKPGELHSIRSQRDRHNWAMNWTDRKAAMNLLLILRITLSKPWYLIMCCTSLNTSPDSSIVFCHYLPLYYIFYHIWIHPHTI